MPLTVDWLPLVGLAGSPRESPPVGAGGGGEGAMDAANILKPALARGELRSIGATTLNEYQKYCKYVVNVILSFQANHCNIDAKMLGLLCPVLFQLDRLGTSCAQKV